MKKVLVFILLLGLILNFGCAKSTHTTNISKQDSNANNLKPSTPANLEPSMQVDLNTNQTDATNNSIITNTENVDNSFFFKSNIPQLNYKGDFLFNDIVEKNVKLHINEMANLKYGKLYELKIDSIEGVPDERLNLGYFYVQREKIFSMEPTEENLNRLKTSEEMPNDSVIVCQDKEINDTLSKDEQGWHQYIVVNGNKREYHSYNNIVETGYYESFTWEKNEGLIYYQSGYGAQRDSIELKLSND